MRILVIGHLQAVEGFELAGIEGVRASTADQINATLDKALTRPEIGVILMTSEAVNLIRERFTQLQMKGEPPELIEIPGPSGGDDALRSLQALVTNAVGVQRKESI